MGDVAAMLKGAGQGGSSGSVASVPSLKLPKASLAVYFRPHSKYKGEYGIDWWRSSKLCPLTDRINDDDVYGNYMVGDKQVEQHNGGQFAKAPKVFTMFPKRAYEHFPEPRGMAEDYLVPNITLLPGGVAKFSLACFIKTPARRISFKYDKNYFKVNKKGIDHIITKDTLLENYLTVQARKKGFSTPQLLTVVADGIKVGQVKFMANSKSKQKSLVVVLVNTTIKTANGEVKVGKPFSDDKKMIKRMLGQCLVRVKFKTEKLDLTSDPEINGVFWNNSKIVINRNNQWGDIKLTAALYGCYARPKVPNMVRVFYFDTSAVVLRRNAGVTQVRTIVHGFSPPGGQIATIFNTASSVATCHELLHSLGLEHSFSNKAEYTFKKGDTYNIMDYAKVTSTTWKWQWDHVRGKL